MFARKKQSDLVNQLENDVLVWTGPRATDIVNCEEGLFNGSITLYGQNDGTKKIETWGLGGFDSIVNGLMIPDHSEDTEKQRFAPNRCFCNSPFNIEGIGKRINHNRSDIEESDLFILAEQLILIKICDKRKKVLRFMPYNQNFVGRHGHEDQYPLMGGVMILLNISNKCANQTPGNWDRLKIRD